MITTPLSWVFNGTVYDKGKAGFPCAICGRQSRFACEVQSVKNEKWRCYVGTDCLAKTTIAQVSNVNKLLWIAENKAKLIREARGRRLTKFLLDIKRTSPKTNLSSLLLCSTKSLKLSPKQGVFLHRLAIKNSLELDDGIVSIGIAKEKCREQIASMSIGDYELLKEYLTKNQIIVSDRLRTKAATD